jgi:hypothetical protein
LLLAGAFSPLPPLFGWLVGRVLLKPLIPLPLDCPVIFHFLTFDNLTPTHVLGFVLLGIGNENGLGLDFDSSGFI